MPPRSGKTTLIHKLGSNQLSGSEVVIVETRDASVGNNLHSKPKPDNVWSLDKLWRNLNTYKFPKIQWLLIDDAEILYSTPHQWDGLVKLPGPINIVFFASHAPDYERPDVVSQLRALYVSRIGWSEVVLDDDEQHELVTRILSHPDAEPHLDWLATLIEQVRQDTRGHAVALRMIVQHLMLLHPCDPHLPANVDMLSVVQDYYQHTFPDSYLARCIAGAGHDTSGLDVHEQQIVSDLLAGKQVRAPSSSCFTAIDSEIKLGEAKRHLLRRHVVVAVPKDTQLYDNPYEQQDNMILAFATRLDEQLAARMVSSS